MRNLIEFTVYLLAQLLSRSECDIRVGRNDDLLSGTQVTTNPWSTIHSGKGAESKENHPLSSQESLGDSGDESFDGPHRLAFR